MSSCIEANEYDYFVSSGGGVAVLAGAGGYSALQLAGVKVRKKFGVSGGAIFSCMASLNRSANQLLHMAVEEDFSKHVDINEGVLGSISEARRLFQLMKKLEWLGTQPDITRGAELNSESWSGTGIFGTTRLGKFIQKSATAAGFADTWPADFMTMATLKNGSQIVFCSEGVFHIDLEDKKHQLSNEPAPLWLAVRASSAIPGVMTAVEFMDCLLFDGALSRDGLCPAGMPIRHFGAQPERIIACRVGEDATHFIMGPAQRAIRRIWMVHPDYHWGPETAGVIEFRPPIDHIHALKFNLSPDEKWLAILIAFDSCLRALALRGLLEGAQRQEAKELLRDLGYWRDIMPAAAGAPQLLAPRAEKVFAEHGLF